MFKSHPAEVKPMGAALQNLNHRHDQIVEWLVVNGHRTLTECAAEFNYTLPWVSQMVHSDLFQAKYVAMCEERKVAAVHSVSAKMTNAVSLALDRTVDKLKEGGNVSDQFLAETRNSLLDRLGYTKAPTAEVHQHLHLSQADLTAARERAQIVNGEKA